VRKTPYIAHAVSSTLQSSSSLRSTINRVKTTKKIEKNIYKIYNITGLGFLPIDEKKKGC
jgi:hypothetical protein